MKFIAFLNDNGKPALGVRQGHGVVDITALGFPSTLDELLRHGEPAMQAVRAAIATTRAVLPLENMRYLPPIANPGKAFAIGLNYREHAAESKFEEPKFPVVFQRYASSWVAHEVPLVRPKVSDQFDYEAELVAVIGKPGRYIPKETALEHVAGYSIFNDGSVRDYQMRSAQWMLGKNFDASGSFGPEFVTADDLPRGASGLKLKCRLNGETVQNANTKDMIFDVATLVSVCSEAMVLNVGDIIITGTPSGVGLARKPQLWMKPGDICEVEIEGIGLLRNAIVAEQ